MEVNFDGIVGPTHNYAGLSPGNLASTENRHHRSYPKQAALQALEKAKRVADLGIPQVMVPPLCRPCLRALRDWGFTGSSDAELIKEAARTHPGLLATAYSSSSMWTANAATVTASSDTADQRVHITPANLIANTHRALESPETALLLKTMLPEDQGFAHHAPLPGGKAFADEGAANHIRLCPDYQDPGLNLFVYGFSSRDASQAERGQFPARQSKCASEAIARAHGLAPQNTLFIQQSREAINAGVFHNDVVATGNKNVLFLHECAFEDQHEALKAIRSAYHRLCGEDLHIIEVQQSDFPLQAAIRSYVFNSQLLSPPASETMTLLCPTESQEDEHVRAYLRDMIDDDSHPIASLQFVNLRESMRNGGGPACLRLRVVLTRDERQAIPASLFLDDPLYDQLKGWIQRHYREELYPDDLSDPQLSGEATQALEALESILQLKLLTER